MRRALLKHIVAVHTVGLLIFGAGCQAPIRHRTASGRPEITINRRVGEQVAAQITNRMLNSGYNIKSATKTLLVFEKLADNFLVGVLLGSEYDSSPAFRITYTIVETTNSTRVVGSFSAITNPGSAFERVTSLNQSKGSMEVQQLLAQLKNSFKDRREPGGRTPKIETREPIAAVKRESELQPPARTVSAWSRLQRGLAEADVRAIIGEPSERSVSPESTIWFYPDTSGGYVMFKNNVVHSWRAP